MPFTETVTIINNSGKIISTGKHLVSIFKDAKAAYQEKKASLRSDRGLPPGPGSLRKANTFDVSPRGPPTQYDDEYDEHGYDYTELDAYHHRQYIEDHGRRRSVDDARSHTSSRRSHGSHRSRRSHSKNHGHEPKSRPPLTASNLRTLSEVSSTAPSTAPKAYRSPYAETAPRDMALSRPTLNHAATMSIVPPTPTALQSPTETPLSTPRQSVLVHRPRSDPSLRHRGKEIDMNLAYGNVPPDLESRVDLDPAYKEVQKEKEARTLMERVEALLLEAQCLHHTATAIISHLQGNPEAAAAVALTLAELSALLGKMSPGFLAIVKGGSPAVFALLASPQFLVGVGVAVGVTVVCFGGWKIIKRIKEAKAAQEQAQAFEMQEQQPVPFPAPPPGMGEFAFHQGAAYGAGGPGSFDDALVLDDELSTIETWRRGIPPFGEDESTVDLELITPEAVRSVREDRYRTETGDAASRKSGKTHRTSKSHRSHRSRRHSDGDEVEIPDRKSSKTFKHREEGDDISDRHSERSHRSSRSKRTDRTTMKAIEDGSRDAENTLDVVLRPKEKKNNMLKQLFKKKKDKADTERERSEVSVMV